MTQKSLKGLLKVGLAAASLVIMASQSKALAKALDLTVPNVYGLQPSISIQKRWLWKPLFNHAANRVDVQSDTAMKNHLQDRFLSRLVEFLQNQTLGKDGKPISQDENDILLRDLVAAKFKAIDLLLISKKFESRELPELQEICSSSVHLCEDGRATIAAFLDVQNRMEEIEAGRLDLRGLTEEQREAFTRHRFLCFYFDIQDAQFREQFKEERIRFFKNVTKSGASTSFEKPLLSSAELTSLTENWDQRLIVAKCWRRERVLDWKANYLKKSLPEVLQN